MNKESLTRPIEFTEWVPNGTDYNLIDRAIPVEPLTDSKLSGLPFQERRRILAERSTAYAAPFLESSFRIPLTEVRPGTLTLASTIHELSSRDWEIQHYSKLAEKEKIDYETEKAAIRSGKRGHKAINKKVEILSKNWQTRNAGVESQVRDARVLQNTILDNFIISTLLTPGGVESFSLAAQDILEQSSIDEDQVNSLLQQATLRLKTQIKLESGEQLRYKSEEGNLVTEKQAKILTQVVKTAFSHPQNSLLDQGLQETAMQLLDFYWKNAGSISMPDDIAPKIGLIHDLLFSACVTDNIQIVRQMVEYISSKIDSDFDTIKQEYQKIAGLHFSEHREFIRQLTKDRTETGFSGSLEEFIYSPLAQFEKWDPKKRGASSIGKYTDRGMGLDAFSILSVFLGGKDYVAMFGYATRNAEDYKMISEYQNLFVEFDRKVLLEFPDTLRLNQLLSNNLTKHAYIKGIKKLTRSSGLLDMHPLSLPTTKARQDYINLRWTRVYDSATIDIQERMTSEHALESMFYDALPEGIEASISMADRNENLRSRIRNNNLWFVAEQGDQFNIKNNPELDNYNIKSITFRPQPHYQGHDVEIKTDLLDSYKNPITINLVVSAEGILLSNGNRLVMPDWVTLSLGNLILTRLHFITSGALGERGSHNKSEGENGQETEVRRSHWRILTSTPERKYTLNSNQARAHAEYVRETYGIDIYEENLRRKLAGTLGKDQVLTFVRAVKGNAEPNQITYIESKIN